MKYRAKVPGIGDPIIQGIDNQIGFEDLAPTIEKIKNMDEGEIRGLLKGITDPGEETERAVQTLMYRKEHLGDAFEHFKSVGAVPTAAGRQRARWWAGLWPRWQWQPAWAPA